MSSTRPWAQNWLGGLIRGAQALHKLEKRARCSSKAETPQMKLLQLEPKLLYLNLSQNMKAERGRRLPEAARGCPRLPEAAQGSIRPRVCRCLEA